MTFATSLAKRMCELNLSANDLAKKLSLSRQSFYRYLSGKSVPTTKNLRKFEQTLGMKPGAWSTDLKINRKTIFYKTEIAARELPILEYSEVLPFIVEKKIPIGVENLNLGGFQIMQKCSDEAFIVAMIGDSMMFHHDMKSVLDQDLIVIDPQLQPRSGDVVLANIRTQDGNNLKVRRFLVDGSDCYLKAINPMYPSLQITPQIEILGTMLFKITQYYFV